MADPLLNALERNLAQAESLGQEDRAAALKKRVTARKSELTREAKAEAAEATESAALADLTVPELRELAKDAGIEGRSGMDKEELLAALKETE